MVMKRKAWLVVSLLLAATLVLSACGADDTGTTGPQTVTGEVVETDQPTTVTTPTDTEEEVAPVVDTGPKYGGTIRVTAWGEPVGWDPAFTMYSQLIYTRPVAGQLISFDWWKGPAGTNEWPYELPWVWPTDNILKGDLAESWEMTGPTTLVYNLRQGVMFQDKPGIMSAREVTADDVVLSMERYMTTEAHLFTTDVNAPNAATAIDKYTVQIDTNMKDWVMMMMRIPTYFPIIPPEVVEQFGDMTDWRNVTGSGPWMLIDYVSGSSIAYKKNPNYWMKDPEGRSLPYADGFLCLIIPEVQTQLTALRSGQLDIMQTVEWDDAEALEKTNPELERRGVLYQSAMKLAFDQKGPPFGPTNDPDALLVRRAASLAIDHEGIIEGYYQGNARIITSTMPPGLTEVLELENLPESSRELWEYNPDKARELLAQAGYPNGLQVTLGAQSAAGGAGTTDTEIAEMVKAMWDAVGIVTEVVPNEGGSHWAKLLSHDVMENGMIHPWGYDVNTSFYDSRGGAAAYFNVAEIMDDDINAIYDLLKDAWDLDERVDLTAQRFLRSIDLAVEVFLPGRYVYNYWQPWIGGYSGELPIGYGGPLAYVNYSWIEESLK